MSRGSILLVAYQCGPGMGSVSQIGWEWYSRLSDEYHVTLVTHIRNKTALVAAGAPLANNEILYIDTEWFASPLYRLAKRIFPRSEHSVFLVSSLDYFVFDLAAFFRLRHAKKNNRTWSLLHRVTPVTLAAPSWLGRLGLPTLIGPLNCSLKDPQGFDEIMRQESSWLISLRKIGTIFDQLIGSSRSACRILTASRATLAGVPLRYRNRCRMMIENGVDLDKFTPTPWPPKPDSSHPLRVLFVGRLIPLKALDMLLRSVAELAAEGLPVQLDIVGDGPMAATWQNLAIKLGIKDKVIFFGNLPLPAVAQQMRLCHVFCLPSVRESGGAVLLEAMSSARPVIAIDFGGPSEIVDAEVGVLISPSSPSQVTNDIAVCLRSVFTDPEIWKSRGDAGRVRVARLYSWPAKISAAKFHYQEVMSERGASC